MRRKRDNISVKYHRQVQEDQSRKASVDFGSTEVTGDLRREKVRATVRRGNQAALG